MVLVEVCIDDGEKLNKTISGVVFFSYRALSTAMLLKGMAKRKAY